ncbi:MAG: DUF2975 domain-containing protein [Prosthecobacter sp.]
MTAPSLLPAQGSSPPMKSSTVLFLQAVIVLVGLCALAFLLGEPHLEGRNAHATVFEIYFEDPFLAYVYVGSIPFFVALYRAFGLFGQVRQAGAFSQGNMAALRAIKRCAMALIAFVAGGMIFILGLGDKEDRPAGLFMGLLVMAAACGVAVVAGTFGNRLQRALAHPKIHEPS